MNKLLSLFYLHSKKTIKITVKICTFHWIESKQKIIQLCTVKINLKFPPFYILINSKGNY
jgi:hypothetical protein